MCQDLPSYTVGKQTATWYNKLESANVKIMPGFFHITEKWTKLKLIYGTICETKTNKCKTRSQIGI